MLKSKLKYLIATAAMLLVACSPARAVEGDLREIKLGSGATQYQLLVPFPAAGTKCLRYMDGADGTTPGKSLGCFKIGPQFVVDANGFLTVPVTKGDTGPAGPQGIPGQMGATGMTGAPGDTGSQGPKGFSAYELAQVNGYNGTLQSWLTSLQGAKGDPGPQGVQGAAGPAGPQGVSIKGDPGAQGVKGDTGPAGAALLRIRATTAADGTYTWTFPTPFVAGTVPVIAIAAEGSSTINYQHTITAVSATSVSVKVLPIADVTLLGIHILGIQNPQAATIHIIASPAP